MGLQDVVSVLETYRGREKTMRTIQYGLLFVTPLASNKSQMALETVSRQLGTARIILRLFDDIPMLQYSLCVINSAKNKDKIVRILELVNTVADQIFFPIEHLAWARDIRVLKGNSSRLWHASLLLWALSLTLSIARSLRVISLLKKTKVTTGENQERLEDQYHSELLTVIMQAADLLNAINWLPNSPFSKPFPQWQVGLFGLISSVIGFSKLLSSFKSS